MRCFFITGGSGTLGEAFIKKAISYGKTVTCFSRCELKQKQLAFRLQSDLVKYVIGDIRDAKALTSAMRDHVNVFHFAALKHVDTCEINPEEALKTNVLGTINVLDACEANRVASMVLSSTDKAVDPINAYGYSKALAEKLVLGKNGAFNASVYRWGNVIGSRGSVIPMIVKTLLASDPHVKITEVDMTRFWIKINDAVNFMWETFLQGDGKILVPNIKAATLLSIVKASAEILNVKSYEVKLIGNRGGEKIHERLWSAHGDSQSFDSSHKGYAFTHEELVEYIKPLVLAEVSK
jgi:UDP-N-acetylglucosamine 4,6-dehydratase